MNFNPVQIRLLRECASLYNNKRNLELECRFGLFKDKKFHPMLSSKAFETIKSFISYHAQKSDSSFELIQIYNNGIKQIDSLDNSNDALDFSHSKKINTSYLSKTKMKSIDIYQYSFRIALSEELKKESNQDGKAAYFKIRKRDSFVMNNIKYDLSTYKESFTSIETLSSQETINMECEIEYNNTSENIDDVYNNFMYNIEQILKCIHGTEHLMTPIETKEILRQYVDIVNPETKPHFIGIQPETLKLSKVFADEEYAITEKLDGERYLLFVNNYGEGYLMSSQLKIKKIGIKSNITSCILDGEYFQGNFYIFDIVFFNGEDLRNNNRFLLHERLSFMKMFVENNNIKYHSNTLLRLYLKTYIFGNLYENITSFVEKNKSHLESGIFDGVIVVSVNSSYSKYSTPWKWKINNTIDFLINKIEISKEFETWELRCSEDDIFPVENFGIVKIPMSIAKEYCDKSVAEFVFKNGAFCPIKNRPDKRKGNYIKVALDNWDSICKPLNFEDLRNLPYSNDKGHYFYMKRFHNYIKRVMLGKYKGHSLLDLGCGKGGDLYKWIDNNIKYIEGYDINKESIEEAQKKAQKCLDISTSKNFDINFYVEDLSLNALQLKKKFDIISCNFALQYFFKNDKILETVAKTLHECTCPGSYFMGTLLDSAASNVIDFEALKNHMRKNDFVLVESMLFEEYFDDWKKLYKNNNLNEMEKKCSFTNRTFVFKRVEDSIDLTKKMNTLTIDSLLLGRPISGKGAWTIKDLKQYCSENGLDVMGKKDELIARIRSN